MRLIIIEDDEQQARNLKRILESKGYAVDWVNDAERARTRLMLYRNEYAVILLDLSLPRGDGLDLTKKVRAEGIATPIIVLTGRGETRAKVELLSNGADDYLVKPFSAEELIARINAVLRRPATSLPSVQSIGKLELDTAAHRVRAGGVEVRLTLKEYSLLECFVRQPNIVLKREDLCNQVWDFNSVTWSNVLDVHMKNLRRKLQRGDSDVRFETVRGVGYRLVA